MNDNLFVVTTDWHVTSNDSEAGITGDTKPTDAANVAAYIRDTLAPAGCINMGDSKDHHDGINDNSDELDQYIANVRGTLPYAEVFAAESALLPILPGNHDEFWDDTMSGAVTDFSPFNAKFWGPPYHWCANWYAAKVRFIGIHSYIKHGPATGAGLGIIDQTEVDWLQDRIDELPANYRAIICSHFPAASAFGNQIRFIGNTLSANDATPLHTLLASNASRIAAYMGGHRHHNFATATLAGVTHIDTPGMAYTLGNAYGGFVPITLDPDARTLSFDYLYGPPHPGGYTRFSGYTPITVQLPLATKLAKVRAA